MHMVEHIYSEKEIAALLEKLNACYPVPVQWSCKRAVQDHMDLFDKKICKGEHYYRLSMGDSRGNDAKLSHQSMQLFLFLLFAPRPYWEQDIDKIIDGRFEQVRRIMDNLRPLYIRFLMGRRAALAGDPATEGGARQKMGSFFFNRQK